MRNGSHIFCLPSTPEPNAAVRIAGSIAQIQRLHACTAANGPSPAAQEAVHGTVGRSAVGIDLTDILGGVPGILGRTGGLLGHGTPGGYSSKFSPGKAGAGGRRLVG